MLIFFSTETPTNALKNFSFLKSLSSSRFRLQFLFRTHYKYLFRNWNLAIIFFSFNWVTVNQWIIDLWKPKTKKRDVDRVCRDEFCHENLMNTSFIAEENSHKQQTINYLLMNFDL